MSLSGYMAQSTIHMPAATILLDRYELLTPLGHGGAATSWLAFDQLRRRRVALKLLRNPSPELVQALRHEFHILRSLRHPRIVRLLDFSLLPGPHPSCFLTSELVDGKTIDRFAASASWPDVRAALIDALQALRWLHARRIRHGDIKPANLLVDSDAHATLIDLGCARPIPSPPDSALCGTPGFLAPELLARTPADERADLYAFGVTLRMLTDGRSDVPASVRKLIPRLVASDPAQRPVDAGEVLEVFDVEPFAVRPVLARTGKLVGRDDIVRHALPAIEALVAGRPGPRLVEIAGEDGVGRTRLLRELGWEAQKSTRVVEADPLATDSIGRMVATLVREGAAITSAAALLDALDRLRLARDPAVLVVDDVHRMHPDQLLLLQALCRSLAPADPFLVLSATDLRTTLDASDAVRITLQPLSADDVAVWVGDALTRESVSALHRATAGFPAALVATLEALEAGRITEAEVTSGATTVAMDERRVDRVRTLSDASQAALAWLIAQQPGDAPPDAFGPGALAELAEAGIAHDDGGLWRLRRGSEAALLSSVVPQRLMRDTHTTLARAAAKEALDPARAIEDRSEAAARQTFHLARAGALPAAVACFTSSQGWHARTPAAWLAAADELLRAGVQGHVAVARCALMRRVGHARQAVEHLDTLLSGELEQDVAIEAEYELGACLLDSGDLGRAIPALRGSLSRPMQHPWPAKFATLLARALTRSGDYGGAAEQARFALDQGPDDATKVEALLSAAVAASYLHDVLSSRQHMALAASLAEQVRDDRLSIRLHGSRGLIEFNAGALEAAIESYRGALETAQRSRHADLAATAALNLGTACHQAGRWNEAVQAYERGMRLAVALGQRSTEAVLRFDLVRLYLDIGLFDRAEALLPRAEQVAEQSGASLARAELDTLRAELAQWRGQLDAARDLLRKAAVTFTEHHSVRERAEVEIHLAEVSTAAGMLDMAEEHLQSAQSVLGADVPPDLRLRLAVANAEALLARREPARALAVLESTLRDTPPSNVPDTQARAHLVIAAIWEGQGATLLADRHRKEARSIWERIAALLPDPLREPFWLHPLRRGARPVHATPDKPRGDGVDARFDRLLEVNKRINSTLDTQEILRRTMDAAIELTGAERGFVLLRDTAAGAGDRLRVAVARNLDREHVDRAQIKFSRAIAQQVIESASPITSADARVDIRFVQAASVHAMQLASVLCVPVIAPAGVMGALYLDHRFQPGRFADSDVRVLQAFADQVAIALTNARLHQELARRTRQLEEKNRQIEALMQSQATRIERLEEQVRAASPRAAYRHDYGPIVGSSRPMQQVFALLDRVIDTDLPILITGESGTGKELVARAIHGNSKRASGPMISINCGAVPEPLLESELFGYERGAFTGAERRRDGLMLQASGGTLFLDEFGELPLTMQVKLLRVLQDRVVRPLGAHRSLTVDFRLVCATNRKLPDELARGTFREDLYYRVSAIEVALPPLRDRLEDLPAIAASILERAARDASRPVPQLTRSALQKLLSAPWPGNVRQLENVLLKAVVLCDGDRITAKDIELPSSDAGVPSPLSRSAWQRVERDRIERALVEHRWNVARVSRELGIPRPTLYRKLARYGLSTKRDDDPAA